MHLPTPTAEWLQCWASGLCSAAGGGAAWLSPSLSAGSDWAELRHPTLVTSSPET